MCDGPPGRGGRGGDERDGEVPPGVPARRRPQGRGGSCSRARVIDFWRPGGRVRFHLSGSGGRCQSRGRNKPLEVAPMRAVVAHVVSPCPRGGGHPAVEPAVRPVARCAAVAREIRFATDSGG
ncbi:hypothetical protein GCM10025787_52240 [Saccharopolyspora rosea]